MDRLSKEHRSRNMAAVQGKNTKPELRVRSKIHRAGFRYALHKRNLPGRPDLVFPKYRVAAFVNGCFWHGHDCPRGKRPATRRHFWDEKLEKNALRDRLNAEALESQGWKVFVIWECSLDEGVDQLLNLLNTKRAGVPSIRDLHFDGRYS